MDLPDAPPTTSVNSCVSCKQGKRKCNRARPSCSTCTRVNRPCHYEEDTYAFPHTAGSYLSQSQSLPSRSSDDGTPAPVLSQSHTTSPNPGPGVFAPGLLVDPFRHEALRVPTVNVAVSTEAKRVLRSVEDIREMATKYFSTIGQRLPIFSQAIFFEKLPSIFTVPEADFVVVCLAMHLVLQIPSTLGNGVGEKSMVTSEYVMLKSFISLLEATDVLTLEVVQARLLVVFYEVGHGLQRAASTGIAACARAARLLGLNKKRWMNGAEDGSGEEGYERRVRKEEAKRVWWAVVNLDRFICLCNGDSLFTTEDPHSSDTLPIEDTSWSQNLIPSTPPHTLSTPSDITLGYFARECQIAHLLGLTLRHVYEPSSSPEFHAQEAMQLERTLMAFLPLLIEEHTKFGLYCAALGVCSCALFTLHTSSLLSPHTLSSQNAAYKRTLLSSLTSSSTQITEFSRHLFGDIAQVDFETMSPLIPHSLYQAAVVQGRLAKEMGEAGGLGMGYRNGLEGLVGILGLFGRRWGVGDRYVEALQALTTDFPDTTLPLSGTYVSPSGPTG